MEIGREMALKSLSTAAEKYKLVKRLCLNRVRLFAVGSESVQNELPKRCQTMMTTTMTKETDEGERKDRSMKLQWEIGHVSALLSLMKSRD